MAKNILEIVDRIKKLKGIKKDSQVAMALPSKMPEKIWTLR